MIQLLKKLKGYWRKQPWCNEGKVKVTPWHVYAGTRGKRRYSSNQFASSALAPCSGRFTPEKDMIPIVQDAAWAWGRHGRHGKSRPIRPASRYSSGGTTPKFAWRESKTTTNLSSANVPNYIRTTHPPNIHEYSVTTSPTRAVPIYHFVPFGSTYSTKYLVSVLHNVGQTVS